MALLNPPVQEYGSFSGDAPVTFVPLEAVWADGRLDITRRKSLREVSTGYTRFRAGDVLVPKVTPTFQAARVAVVPRLETGIGAGSTELHVLRPIASVADPRFLAYVCRSAPFLQGGVAAFQGVAGLQRVPESYVADFEVRVTDIDEQRRIADCLDDQAGQFDSARTHIERGLAASEEEFRAILWREVTGATQTSLKPTSLPWAPLVPSEWGVAKITRFARLGTGHTPSRSRPEWWSDPTIPWVTTGEVHQFRDDQIETVTETREMISALGLENSAAVLHPTGTVVLSRTASAGFSAIMGADMATSQDYVSWTCGEKLEPAYLLWCLRAMRPYLLGYLSQGSTHKTIYFPDVQAMKIPVPPIDEQRHIVERVRRAREHSLHVARAYRKLRDLLTERQRSVISLAVSGELDVAMARRAVA